MEQIINGKKYSTETASLIASDRFFDGSNFERDGRNTYLYQTKRGAFFLYHTTMWQGERDYIEPCTIEDAQDHYEHLPEHETTYKQAFGQEPEEA